MKMRGNNRRGGLCDHYTSVWSVISILLISFGVSHSLDSRAGEVRIVPDGVSDSRNIVLDDSTQAPAGPLRVLVNLSCVRPNGHYYGETALDTSLLLYTLKMKDLDPVKVSFPIQMLAYGNFNISLPAEQGADIRVVRTTTIKELPTYLSKWMAYMARYTGASADIETKTETTLFEGKVTSFGLQKLPYNSCSELVVPQGLVSVKGPKPDCALATFTESTSTSPRQVSIKGFYKHAEAPNPDPESAEKVEKVLFYPMSYIAPGKNPESTYGWTMPCSWRNNCQYQPVVTYSVSPAAGNVIEGIADRNSFTASVQLRSGPEGSKATGGFSMLDVRTSVNLASEIKSTGNFDKAAVEALVEKQVFRKCVVDGQKPNPNKPAEPKCEDPKAEAKNTQVYPTIESHMNANLSLLTVNAIIPGAGHYAGFCGGSASPIMLFFDEQRPKFTNASGFPIQSGKIRTRWPEAKSPGFFLALDQDGNGKITMQQELFGESVKYKNGFEALKVYDSNRDGVIDRKDPVYKELVLWRDENGDGVSQASELKHLKDFAITSIALKYESNQMETYADNAQGRERATFQFLDSKTKKSKQGAVVDIWFAPERSLASQ